MLFSEYVAGKPLTTYQVAGLLRLMSVMHDDVLASAADEVES